MWWLSQEKNTCAIIWVTSWTSRFFWKNVWQTNYAYLDLNIWQMFSQKKNKVSLSLQEKWLAVFVASDKILAFKKKWGFLENFCLPPWAWQLLKHTFKKVYLTTSLMRSVVMLMSIFSWYCVMKCVKIWKTCMTQWTDVFQRPVCDVQALYKGLFKCKMD